MPPTIQSGLICPRENSSMDLRKDDQTLGGLLTTKSAKPFIAIYRLFLDSMI